MTERGVGTVLQVGLAAAGPGSAAVPGLLDRVAHAIRELGAVDVADIVFRPPTVGDAAAMSVYFVRAD